MNKKTISQSVLLLFLCCILFCSCGGKKSSPSRSGPVRDNTPQALVPEASGTTTYGNDIVTFDASHTDQGYMMVQYRGSNGKVKLQFAAPDGTTYTYLLSQSGAYETFPFSAGSGTYSASLLENVQDDMYSIAFAQDIEVNIADEFSPFLYPNQYVSFTPDSEAVKKGEALAKGAHSDLEVVENIYHYVIENVSYDNEKATSVTYGYLPVVDETLKSGKGICFDYASLMAAMLRSQGIPTKLDIGYAGDAYHSWISTYVDDKGWIDNIIEFDGTSWELMDPTFAANSDNKSLKEAVGDGTNYVLKYTY